MILMPVAGWLMGRIARAPFPVPAVLAAATVPYIFGQLFESTAATSVSTLAGEFAFGWSLWFALVFLGLVIRGPADRALPGMGGGHVGLLLHVAYRPGHVRRRRALRVGFMYAVRNRDWMGAFWWSSRPSWSGACSLRGGHCPLRPSAPRRVRHQHGLPRNTAYITTLFPSG